MSFPRLIHNQDENFLDEVLERLLMAREDSFLDIASTQFGLNGFARLRQALFAQKAVRVLLGAFAGFGSDSLPLPATITVPKQLRRELEQFPYDEEHLTLVRDLMFFLGNQRVEVRLLYQGFLTTNLYLVQGNRNDEMSPRAAIVGSSTFSMQGFRSPQELNVLCLAENPETGEVDSEPVADTARDLAHWFEGRWSRSWSFKSELLDILDSSKFGRKDYMPYQVYMKTLHEYFLGGEEPPEEAPSLTGDFHYYALRQAREIIGRHRGVMIADSLGLGMRWLARKLFEERVVLPGFRSLLICPAVYVKPWQEEFSETAAPPEVITHEDVASGTVKLEHKVDMLVINHSELFNDPTSIAYRNLRSLIEKLDDAYTGDEPLPIILMTRSPITGDLMDLYHQLSLITRGDNEYFSCVGIEDLFGYFLRAKKYPQKSTGIVAVYNLLEEVVVRRSRAFLAKNPSSGAIFGRKIRLPMRTLTSIAYDLPAAYGNAFEPLLTCLRNLTLAPLLLDGFQRSHAGEEIDTIRLAALRGQLDLHYLCRLESSPAALRLSITRIRHLLTAFQRFSLRNYLPAGMDASVVSRYLAVESCHTIVTEAISEEDQSTSVSKLLETLTPTDPADYNLRDLLDALRKDEKLVATMLQLINDLSAASDTKLVCLKELLVKHRGRRIAVVCAYDETAAYLFTRLTDAKAPDSAAFRSQAGGMHIETLTAGDTPETRVERIARFSPGLVGHKGDSDKPIDVLIATDVLPERIADCEVMICYDAPWNPTILPLRAAKVDRTGSFHDRLEVCQLLPRQGLDSLMERARSANDAILAGETAGTRTNAIGYALHPGSFSVISRLAAGDTSVLEQEESFSELIGNDAHLTRLERFLAGGGSSTLSLLPNGIHSGIHERTPIGIMFFYKATPRDSETYHFLRYFNVETGKISDNRFLILKQVICKELQVREVAQEALDSIFDIQEKIVDDIMAAFKQDDDAECAEDVQQALLQSLTQAVKNGELERHRSVSLIRLLNQALTSGYREALRRLRATYLREHNLEALLGGLEALCRRHAAGDILHRRGVRRDLPRIKRSDLKLVCFEFFGF
ncbi:hypothetical protein JW905_17370 [bacterium]|nr:hypothetical protein [candidate division CSSED10-310 bacterium]